MIFHRKFTIPFTLPIIITWNFKCTLRSGKTFPPRAAASVQRRKQSPVSSRLMRRSSKRRNNNNYGNGLKLVFWWESGGLRRGSGGIDGERRRTRMKAAKTANAGFSPAYILWRYVGATVDTREGLKSCNDVAGMTGRIGFCGRGRTYVHWLLVPTSEIYEVLALLRDGNGT